MNLRQALIQQSPSLALQRAAGDEIARLDARCASLNRALDMAMAVLQETVINEEMYAMEIEDPDHPWHVDIRMIRALRADPRSILDIQTFKESP